MASILITSYLRSSYLQFHFCSLISQKEVDWSQHEIIVLNDGVEDTTLGVCQYFHDLGLPIRYLFTGQRNRNGMQWRVPGYAWNIGIQECDSNIVVLTCAEMYHVGNTLNPIISPVLQDEKALGTPNQIYEDKGMLIGALSKENNEKRPSLIKRGLQQSYITSKSPFSPHQDMPFWMAIARKNLVEIGGFDEDFIGVACEDSDLMNRLLAFGCYYRKVEATVIHLNHGTRNPKDIFADPRYKYNHKLMDSRKNQITRNVGRKWGTLTEKFSDIAEYHKHETFPRDHKSASLILWNLLPNNYSVLDVGCGDCVISTHVKSKVKCHIHTVDGWAKTKPDTLLQLETEALPFESNSFDIVLLMDVVEHLEKQAALKLIKQCQEICRVRVIVCTPKDFCTNENSYNTNPLHKGNELILHKSSWEENDFHSLGFTIQDHFPTAFFGLWEK